MIKNRFLNFLELHRSVVALLLLASFALHGCVKRTLEERPGAEEGIEIALEWEQGVAPIPLTFAFYRVGDATLLYKEFEGTAEGFTGTLPVGNYKVIAYDKQAQKVGFRNMDTYDGAEVYTLTPEALKASKAEDNILITEPGAVYAIGGCVGMDVLSIVAGESCKAKSCPMNMTRSVLLKFEVTNGANITTISGVMEGVSSSVLLSTGASMNYSASLPFHVDCATDGSFQVAVSLFDFIAAEAGATEVNTMDVTLGSEDGGTHDLTLDLTDTIRDIIHDNGGVIPIEIPIEVVVDMTNIDRITATVKPWDKGAGGGEVID